MSITREYQAELRKQHEERGHWGSSAVRYGAGDDITVILNKKIYRGIKTVLDYGCGQGTLGDFIRENAPGRVKWFEYDPGIPGKDVKPEGQFDLVLTTDVLEHVEPHLLDETIAELASLTRLVMYNNIPNTPAGSDFITGPYVGQNLHLIVESPEWWHEKINGIVFPKFVRAEFRTIIRHGGCGDKTRCMFVHERVRK
ncbi:hypothetical protein LCGC14_0808520 [marine sediment metagenome]|uniref:Methyltransferase domain-containing protein n=1 Tax=marine sediment metagenome TaxID=412755 RepID=A0A0F9PMG2_9ZZZZ